MPIEIHADRARLALVEGGGLPWVPSPEPGVERRMLERAGGEVALATSIVRYAAGSRFRAHVHELGEEFLVLSGIFSDASGDYPAGTYVRNPPGSAHSTHSDAGCEILVKLRQMQPDESHSVRVFPDERCWRSVGEGAENARLYDNQRVTVDLLRLNAGAPLAERQVHGGEELFVVSGAIELPGSALHSWGWRRSADRDQPAVRSAGGALLWIKRGHL